nr:hypothetical protein KPHV_40430 [Kitasatospora purpeofusca]
MNGRRSGTRFLKAFAVFDPNSSSWKMSLRSGGAGSRKYSGDWPKSGTTFGGRAFELPELEPPTIVTDGSPSRLLKTPTANLGINGGPQHPDKRRGARATSGSAGGQSADSRAQPHGATLADEACFLLPYADRQRRLGGSGDEPGAEGWSESADARHSPSAWWGDYLPAVRRWERIFGRAAPAPTERGPRGGIRLTARFGEWLMGLAAGWVTDVPGLNRGQQLKAIGNGVSPQQAFVAYEHLLTHTGDDVPDGETRQD